MDTARHLPSGTPTKHTLTCEIVANLCLEPFRTGMKMDTWKKWAKSTALAGAVIGDIQVKR